MNHRPRSPRIRTDREEFWHDIAIGLAAVLVVIVLSLVGQAIAAPDTAQAHTVKPADCRQYAAMHRLVTGEPRLARLAVKRCHVASHEHAHAHCNRIDPYQRANRCTIRLVFGAYGPAALRVSWCESSHRTWAANGQYRGLFQMGSNERATYGHGRTARAQSEAAFRYFNASGRDWSPWECQP